MSFVFFLSLLLLTVFISPAQGAEEQTYQFTALELSQKTDEFWNSLKSLDLTYRFISPYFDPNEHGKPYPSVETNRWIVDFQTGRRAGRQNPPEGIKDAFHICIWYYDGKNTYVTEGADVESIVQSELEGIEKNAKFHRSALIIPKITEKDVCWQNCSYRSWYVNGKSSFFNFSNFQEDNTFVEFIEKYPTSTPIRSIAENGDVLWSFNVFPDREAKDAFPEAKGTGICFKEFIINETKNFLVQEIRNTCRYVHSDGNSVQKVSFFRVTDYLKIDNMWFPKRSVYGNDVENPERFDNQIHEVVDLKVNAANIDFSLFKIPAFTPRVDIKDSTGTKIEKTALWGKEDKPTKEFTSFDDYLQYIQDRGLENVKMKHEELKRQKAENLTTRIALCVLGLALVATAIWLKRRNRKTKLEADSGQA